jgi:hypothetical protein
MRAVRVAALLIVYALSLQPGLGQTDIASAASPRVYLNVPSVHTERPTSITDNLPTPADPHDSTKFLDVQAFLSGLAWSSWGGATASGSGRLEVNSSDTRPGHVEPYASQSAAVSITASGLTSCGGFQVYTSYTLTLAPGQAEPRDFELVSHRSLPCRLHALDYYAGYERVANTTGDCLFKGVSGQLPPGFGYLGYCRMRWTGWNEPTTAGTGIGRAVTLPRGCDGRPGTECDYGIRVRLSEPAWCPEYGLSYTRERLEVFGSGIPLESEPHATEIAPSIEARLRSAIGRGKPTRIVYARAQECDS